MFWPISAYTRWLHTRWPAGTVEKLPLVREHGRTNVSGLYVVGDLTGIPLLKFSADSGAKAVQDIAADKGFQKLREDAAGKEGAEAAVTDIVIIGAGVSGMAAALEAKKHGFSYKLLEAAQPFSTIVNFPKAKPIYTYPTGMEPAGDLRFTAEVKEPLIEELEKQTEGVEVTVARADKIARTGNLLEVVTAGDDPNILARRVIVGIGRSGNFRKLGVPGEDLDKVSNRLHDPKDFVEKNVLVVGGGDSALETAIALAQGGAKVVLSYRKAEFSRAKPDNVESLIKLQADANADVSVSQPSSERASTATGAWVRDSLRIDRQRAGQAEASGSIRVLLESEVKEIRDREVVLTVKQAGDGGEETIPNDQVFSMIGREAPLDFFRRSGVQIIGDVKSPRFWITFSLIFLFCVWLYHWKKWGSEMFTFFADRQWFPHNIAGWVESTGGQFAAWANDPTTWVGTIVATSKDPGFYYSALYCLLVIIFGIRRIRRRKTPYVKVQTLTLAAFQIIPLFLLPYWIFPYLGHNGAYDRGSGKWFADEFFPYDAADYGGKRWELVDQHLDPLKNEREQLRLQLAAAGGGDGGETPDLAAVQAELDKLQQEKADLELGIREKWGTEQDLENKRKRIAVIDPIIARLQSALSPETPEQKVQKQIEELVTEKGDLEYGIEQKWGTEQDLDNKRARIRVIEPQIALLRQSRATLEELQQQIDALVAQKAGVTDDAKIANIDQQIEALNTKRAAVPLDPETARARERLTQIEPEIARLERLWHVFDELNRLEAELRDASGRTLQNVQAEIRKWRNQPKADAKAITTLAHDLDNLRAQAATDETKKQIAEKEGKLEELKKQAEVNKTEQPKKIAELEAQLEPARAKINHDKVPALEQLVWPARRIAQAMLAKRDLGWKEAEFRRDGEKQDIPRADALKARADRIGDVDAAAAHFNAAVAARDAKDDATLTTEINAAIDAVHVSQPHSYWRSFGFILAWPLFVYNWFTATPIWGWIILGLIQSFVIIPLIVRKWGKGAYCGWICSCGALAETLGDAHRHKMPHGPVWNRLNMIGQVFLLFAIVIMIVRIVGWLNPDSSANALFTTLLYGDHDHGLMDWFNYAYFVDVFWAGIIGIAFYFHFSGRVWCRFACPLAALMHIYARFTRFRIVAEKKKCISCNVCTSVCHQGIDIMNFANKGVPMSDPECVRCSACVQSCPTGVLQFGEVNPKTNEVIRLDRLSASPVRAQEGKGTAGFQNLGGGGTVGKISGGYTE